MYAANQESTRDGADVAAADSDRWAAAASSLLAAWENHENRYPERERVTHKGINSQWRRPETGTSEIPDFPEK
jgi:hypothetical protein